MSVIIQYIKLKPMGQFFFPIHYIFHSYRSIELINWTGFFYITIFFFVC